MRKFSVSFRVFRGFKNFCKRIALCFMNHESRLATLSITLPAAPKPAGNYVPYVLTGQHLVIAGTICLVDGQMQMTGKVGETHDIDGGYAAARLCALNSIAIMREALGSLDKVRRIVLVQGYVNATSGFTRSPQVINGASDCFAEIFGEAGKHARTAVAVTGLPLDSTVEIQVTAEVDA